MFRQEVCSTGWRTQLGICLLALLSLAGCGGLETPASEAPVGRINAALTTSSPFVELSINGNCLDVSWYGTANGTFVTSHPCAHTANEQWKYDPATQQITGYGGKCLEVANYNTSQGATLQMWDCYGGANQKWAWRSYGMQLWGYGNQCIQMDGSGAVMEPCADWTVFAVNPPQWLRSDPSPRTYPVEAWAGLQTRCIDLPAYNTANGTSIDTWDCVNQGNEKWYWNQNGDQSIRSAYNTNKCLTVRRNGTANGTAVEIWDCLGRANQKWNVTPDGMVIGYGGKCLDIAWSGMANGTPVWMWDCYGGESQYWHISQ